MPVSPKFAKELYEKLGEDLATGFAEWFESVDTTYRADLREINAHNFALFDAKLEQRLAELRAELKGDIAELRAETRIELANTKSSLIRWMFGFWIGSWLTIVGTLIALGQLGVLVPR